MKKCVLRFLLAALTILAVPAVSAAAADTGEETIELRGNGQNAEVRLTIPKASGEGLSSLQLSLNVTADSPGASNVSFYFSDLGNAKVKEYRYNQESGILNLYIAGTDSIFSRSDESLFLGTIAVSDVNGAGQAFTVCVPQEGALKLPGRSKAEAISFADIPELHISISSDGNVDENVPGGSVPGNNGGGGSGVSGGAGEDSSGWQSVDAAKGYDRNIYTKESYSAMEDALKKAENTLKSKDASEKEKEEALLNLENAVGALKNNKPTSAEEKHSKSQKESDSAKLTSSKPILLYVMVGILCVLLLMAGLYWIIYRQSQKRRL
ncbi:hypothetical protein AALA78_06775 [Lachnospiraceae bacterium 42-17]|jgi:hypothetical protein|nr:hypothetical protein [Dorea sp.]